jgi:hypothetical protein
MSFGDMLRRSREVPDLRSSDPSEAEWVPSPARDDRKAGSAAIHMAANYHRIVAGLYPEGVSPEVLAEVRRRQRDVASKRHDSPPRFRYRLD